jgi:hypothetical protein
MPLPAPSYDWLLGDRGLLRPDCTREVGRQVPGVGDELGPGPGTGRGQQADVQAVQNARSEGLFVE